MTLQEAYLFADEAERAATKRSYRKGSELHQKAAESFKNALLTVQKEGVTDPKIVQALELLSSQHQKSAIQLKYQARIQKSVEKKARELSKNKKSGASPTVGKNNILDALASKRGQRHLDTKSAGFIGEYSIINDGDSSLLSAMIGKSGNDAGGVQQLIMNLFSTLEISPTSDALTEEKAPENSVLSVPNLEILNRKTKEELAIENQQLKTNIVQLNRYVERLSGTGAPGLRDLVLIDKKKFQTNLAAILQQSLVKSHIPGKSSASNSFASAPRQLFSNLNPAIGPATNDPALLASQAVSEKETEISRLLQLVRNQERQIQRLTKSFKASEQDKNMLVEKHNSLKKEYLRLQQQTNLVTRNQTRHAFHGLNSLNEQYEFFDAHKIPTGSNVPTKQKVNLILQSDDDEDEDDDDDDDLYDDDEDEQENDNSSSEIEGIDSKRNTKISRVATVFDRIASID